MWLHHPENLRSSSSCWPSGLQSGGSLDGTPLPRSVHSSHRGWERSSRSVITFYTATWAFLACATWFQ